MAAGRPRLAAIMGLRIIQTDDPLRDPAVLALRDALRAGTLAAGGRSAPDVRKAVAEIIAQVESRGDEALAELTEKLDAVRPSPRGPRVAPEEIERARADADPAVLAAIRRAADNIRQYQERILIKPPRPLRRSGRMLAVRYTPMDRVGICVPGGRAAYPSTLLMTAVPAQVAGVGEIVLASPPKAGGEVDLTVLAVAGELGLTEVYRIGGAQAVAAMAIGTGTIRPVQKIVGPGNAYVSEAKRQLFGRVGIDSIAGPSEVLILADDTADPRWLAADVGVILQRALELFPDARPGTISDNGPQFIARDFEEFIALCGMAHVRTSPHCPQSNGKLERYHRTIKADGIRPHTPLSLEEARRIVERFVRHYNEVRLHSAIQYITPADKLAGRAEAILAARDTKLAAARQARKARRISAGSIEPQRERIPA